MEYLSSDMNNFAQYPVPSRTDSTPFQSINGFFNPTTTDQGMQPCLQRTSSDNILKEEQPLWLEELLDEPEVQIRHQRSSSDPFAYLDKHEECNSRNLPLGSSFPDKHKNWTNESPHHSASRTDTKWAKQKLAQRSRIRKINYIAELERNVQVLQAEGSEFSAALNFLDQQNLILGMENQALKQRLDSLSQEKLIKHLEQGLLEREITRLQMLYQLQMQQQQQHQQQQQQQKNPGRRQFIKTRDLDSQFANLSLQHKETSS